MVLGHATNNAIYRPDANELSEVTELVLVHAPPQLDRPEAVRVGSDARCTSRKLTLIRDGLWVRGPFGAHLIEHALGILASLECDDPATRPRIGLERAAWNGFGAVKCEKPAVDDFPPAPSDNFTDGDLIDTPAFETGQTLRRILWFYTSVPA